MLNVKVRPSKNEHDDMFPCGQQDSNSLPPKQWSASLANSWAAETQLDSNPQLLYHINIHSSSRKKFFLTNTTHSVNNSDIKKGWTAAFAESHHFQCKMSQERYCSTVLANENGPPQLIAFT